MRACDALRQIRLNARGVDRGLDNAPGRAAITAMLRSVLAKGRRRARICRSPDRDCVARAMATLAGGAFLSHILSHIRTIAMGGGGGCAARSRRAFCRRRARDRIEPAAARVWPGGNFPLRRAALISRRFV